jgi:hypothetical protein
MKVLVLNQYKLYCDTFEKKFINCEIDIPITDLHKKQLWFLNINVDSLHNLKQLQIGSTFLLSLFYGLTLQDRKLKVK